jgi:hypothetical protein
MEDKTVDNINLLKSIICSKDFIRMNQSVTVGFLGELLVKKKLEEDGWSDLFHHGKQKGYDLMFENYKIDVKCSTLKKEVNRDYPNWGWALSFKDETKASHYVCVALSNYEPSAYYIINSLNLNQFEAASGQYNKVKHRYLAFLNEIPEGVKGFHEYSKSVSYIEAGTVKIVLPHENLADAVKSI